MILTPPNCLQQLNSLTPSIHLKIPVAWSNLDKRTYVSSRNFSEEHFSQTSFDDLNKLLTKEWKRKETTFNFTELPSSLLGHFVMYHNVYSKYIMIFWNLSLSTLLLVLWHRTFGTYRYPFTAIAQLPAARAASTVTNVTLNHFLVERPHYFSIFFILMGIMNLIILICIAAVLFCLFKNCCGVRIERRNATVAYTPASSPERQDTLEVNRRRRFESPDFVRLYPKVRD